VIAMVEFKIRVNPEQRLAYIPKEIYEAIGSNLKAIPNRAAVLLFPEDMPLKDVRRSLEIIMLDLAHGEALEKQS